MTTRDVLTQDWKSLSGKLRERWYSLGEADVAKINGNYDVLVSVLQEKYFYGTQTAERDVNQFLNESAMTRQPMYDVRLARNQFPREEVRPW